MCSHMREAIVSLSDDEIEALGLGDLMSTCAETGMVGLEEVTCRANGAK